MIELNTYYGRRDALIQTLMEKTLAWLRLNPRTRDLVVPAQQVIAEKKVKGMTLAMLPQPGSHGMVDFWSEPACCHNPVSIDDPAVLEAVVWSLLYGADYSEEAERELELFLTELAQTLKDDKTS